MGKYAVITALLIGFLSSKLYIPLPEGTNEAWKLRLLHIVNAFSKSVSYWADMLKFDSELNVSRNIYNYLYKHSPEDFSNIQIIKTQFTNVPVLVIQPDGITSLMAGLVYIHGGGFVMGNAESHLPLTIELSRSLNITIVSVNYRLAPENSFPIPFQDCVTATVHFLIHAEEFGVDPSRIGILGEEAGGNLAAAVALRLRGDKTLPALRTQILVSPLLQTVDFLLPSYQTYANLPFLSKEETIKHAFIYVGADLEFVSSAIVNNHTTSVVKTSLYASYIDYRRLPKRFLINYVPSETNFGDVSVGSKLEGKILNSYAFPLMADNYYEFPPSLIVVYEFDVLRDDGLLFAHRLQEFRIQTSTYIINGSVHGLLPLFYKFGTGNEAVSTIVNYCKSNL